LLVVYLTCYIIQYFPNAQLQQQLNMTQLNCGIMSKYQFLSLDSNPKFRTKWANTFVEKMKSIKRKSKKTSCWTDWQAILSPVSTLQPSKLKPKSNRKLAKTILADNVVFTDGFTSNHAQPNWTYKKVKTKHFQLMVKQRRLKF